MPLMEDHQDPYIDDPMDDLFGESEEIPLTAAPPIKGLALRLDELASTNCAQKIAWSRFGCLAAVSEGARGVDIYTFIRDAKTGTWNLSKPIPLWPPIDEHHYIVHIAWSHMGNDLTIIDCSGRVLIYSTGFALGQMMLVRQHINDQDDDMSALVGLHWLPVHPHTQKSTTPWSATRSGEDWAVKMSQHDSLGPHNPVEAKSALICLSKSGTLRLLYQQRDGRWLETSTEIGDSGSAVESSFTHASFAPDVENSLLLLAHQVSGSLRLFRIKVNWNLPTEQKDGQHAQQSASPPSLDVSALLEENSCFPASMFAADQDTPSNPTLDSQVSYQLTYLELLPNAPEHGRDISQGQASILAAFTILPPPRVMLDSSDPSGVMLNTSTSHQYQQVTGIVSRWQLRKAVQDKLPACFEQLSVKKMSTTAIAPRQRIRLERLPDITLGSAVLSASSLRNGTMLAFSMSDGSTHFRYRDSMDIVTADENYDEVKSLPQSGFIFPTVEPSSLYIAFSPNACVLAFLKPDGTPKIESMKYGLGSLIDILPNDPKLGSVAAVVALEHTFSCYQYRSSDDLLSILPSKLSESMTHAILNCATKFLSITFDFVSEESSKQIPSLYRHQMLYKCLSIQNTLGSVDKRGSRRVAARLAWITINLRLVSFNISMNLRSNENLRSEMAMSFVGLVRWSLDLFIYLLQEIFRIYYAIKHKEREGQTGLEKDQDWIHNYIRENHSPALTLLLSSIPRILLRMMLRPLRHGMVHSTNGFKTAISVDHKIAFSKLLQIYQNTPIAIIPFENYLTEVDNLIKSCYKPLSLAERSTIEKTMFLTAAIPTTLMPAVTAMLTTKMDALMGQQDPGKIMGHDVVWLGLTDDKRTKQFLDRQSVDVIRKLPLGKGAKMRRCTRCGSVMEDIQLQGGPQSNQQPWVWQSQKNCVCFASWATGEGK